MDVKSQSTTVPSLQNKTLNALSKPEQGTEKPGKNALKQDDFLSLLTKQLAQQDPFKPVSNDQMIAQMASFSTVDGINKMNEQFGQLNSSITSNQALEAASLVGTEVLVSNEYAIKSADGTVQGQVTLPVGVDQAMVQISTKQGEMIHSLPLESVTAGMQGFTWNGQNDKGQPFPAGSYRLSVTASINDKPQALEVQTYNQVESVVLGKNEVLLNLKGEEKAVSLKDVTQLGQRKEA